MKKVVSVLAAGVMSASLSLTAFAAVIVPDDTSGDTTVKYQVDPAYIVEIPAEVVLQSDQSVEAQLKIYGSEEGQPVLVAGNEEVQVSVDAASVFSVKYSDDELEYDLSADGTAVAPGSIVSSVRSNATKETELSFSAPKSAAKYAGEYTGTVTFDVALVNF